ncbi:MAG: hypothetical protein OXQ94_12550 [Gemmatimonadota bacterium]|nr:hypothetical protein [Gemmatimonadota bacterium]MDE2872502.1 hypothetical protein [Gemmatimonadota bacterium]
MTVRSPVARAAAVLALVLPGPASAQSFLGSRGLGVPVGAVDARAAALGNLGIGLGGAEVSAGDPAAWAGLVLPTVSISMQPTWGEYDLEEQAGTSRATRFPLLGIGYPVPRAKGVVTLSLAGHLEQRWVAESRSTVVLDEREVEVEDRFTSDGSTSVVRLGWAQRLGPRLAVGVAAGTYVGRLNEVFDRELDSLAVGGEVYSFLEENSWQYSGYTVTAGFSADPADLLHLAGAVEWSRDLKEAPEGDTTGENMYSIPPRFSAGATGRLSPRLHLNASAAYQDWSAAEGFADGVVSRRKWNFGVGLEWLMADGETRSLPVRFGYRRLAAPFRYRMEDPVESVWSVGVGFNLLKRDDLRFGWMDVALERGTRTSEPLAERFWRATVTLGVARF